jgi:hypothetical protein
MVCYLESIVVPIANYFTRPYFLFIVEATNSLNASFAILIYLNITFLSEQPVFTNQIKI